MITLGLILAGKLAIAQIGIKTTLATAAGAATLTAGILAYRYSQEKKTHQEATGKVAHKPAA